MVKRFFRLAFCLGSAVLLVIGHPVQTFAVDSESFNRFTERISGGPEVIYEPRAGSDLVCVMVSVMVGSRYETPDTRGISHFLEHLVFDGSERYSREEISDWIDGIGGFLNAFTRKETTVYFILIPSMHLEQGIEILSEMLFSSTFPLPELEKERKVVLEEIRRTRDDPTSRRSRLIDRYLYRGSLLTEPVLGYPTTIESISRHEIISFYRKYYTPERMRVFLMGGFNVREAKGWLIDYFSNGGVPTREGSAGNVSGRARQRGRDQGHPETVPRWSGEITVRRDNELPPGLDIMVPMPSVEEREFSTVLVISKMLQSTKSPFNGMLASLSLPDPEVELEVHREFTALKVHVGPGNGDLSSYRQVPSMLASLADWKPTAEAVKSARVSIRAGEVFDREKYHFYIMLHGKVIALFGDRYLSAVGEGVEKVTPGHCREVLSRFFKPLRFNACLILPDSVALPRWNREFAPKVSVLPNGCTVASLQRADSEVAALHLLIKGRTCIESEYHPGLAAVLHMILDRSSAGEGLSERLAGLGGRLGWGDNPYIPFDDHYLNPSFSFIRLEVPADRVENAAALLVDHLLLSSMTPEDLERAVGKLRMELHIRTGSTGYTLKQVVFSGLFGAHPYGHPLFPSVSSLGGISLEEVERFRGEYLRGGNIIASLVSPAPPGEALEWLGKTFSGFPRGSSSPCPPMPDAMHARIIEEPIQKEGVYIAAGWMMNGMSPERSATLLVAGEVLSRRMQMELRERRGLAYATGCSVVLMPQGGVVIASMGTRSQNLDEASEALKTEIRRLTEEPPDVSEVSTAINRLRGRRARSELSSINEAYSIGVDIFLTGGEGWHYSLNNRITDVSVADLRMLIKDILPLERAVFVRLIPDEQGSGRPFPPGMRR